MNLFKLSLMNIRQSIKNYGVYIFSMVFSIAVFYNFTTLIFSKQFLEIKDLNAVSMAGGMCAFVLIFFFIFFISYSSKFFIEQRKKEFGIYTFMGVENKQIALMFSLEALIIGLISMIIGMGIGILLNKIFLMILVKLSYVNKVINFEINFISVIQTLLIFLIILIGVFIKEYICLIKTDISKLINAKKIYQLENNKLNNTKGVVGFIIIILGYLFILKYKEANVPFTIAIMATVIMTIIGTHFLFRGFFSIFIRNIIKNKKRLYSKTNIVSYNNIIFRIKDNNKTLAQAAILIACSLTCIMVAFCMSSCFSSGFENEYPYSIYYTSENKNDDKSLDMAVNLSNEDVKYKTTVDLIPYKSNLSMYINDVYLVKYSDVEKLLKHGKVKHEKDIEKNKPQKGEAILLVDTRVMNAFKINDNLKISNESIKINKNIPSNIMGQLTNGTLVLNDNDYANLKTKLNKKELYFKGITLKNFENTNSIAQYMRENSKSEIYSADQFDKSAYYAINGVYFVGCFLALVFTVSLGSIMYFKCIQDASIDKERFNTLRKIGVSQEYINKAVFKQLGIFFILPVIVGSIHGIVAGYAVNSMFNSDHLELIGVSLIIFSFIYLIFYIISTKKYISITK
ncbi:ftsX-like permease family protein [[Clostridium] bifermentans ATCC 638]|uniref:FtsX-like permease family protein n=1 Tax=Paraclostridium bifermentans ATCC 638 = DSM 14991 TaxID=1233171 RepID=T4VRL8_PARBF|nr:ABC transporter permease [Paraclostridium bifermentans]EQK43337.1 ftsX-like permease family protein [[Clostridium] bifermentans ATCC 638] [Paraclostridium bifermentans ATCC 638 = DSM 14991]RIZ60554.1 ABC transporter permease [Paraclostridium bifermentans]UAG17196.1 ABC transporter permease [Paraclostridium bifermentans]